MPNKAGLRLGVITTKIAECFLNRAIKSVHGHDRFANVVVVAIFTGKIANMCWLDDVRKYHFYLTIKIWDTIGKSIFSIIGF